MVQMEGIVWVAGHRFDLEHPHHSLGALCWAAENNCSPAIIEAIAAKCDDISAIGPDGCPPLHAGAREGHVSVVHELLLLGARVDAIDHERCTALHIAAKWGRREILEALTVARPDLDAVDWTERSALHYACKYAKENGNDNSMAEALLYRGADVNSSDEWGYTPVILAMENPSLMKLIIALGTKPPTEQAARYVGQCRGKRERAEVLELLVANGWGLHSPGARSDAAHVDSALHQIVNGGDTDRLTELLRLGENPETLDRNGRTPLHIAAHSGNVTMVEALLAARGALYVKSRPYGWTPLHVAARQGHVGATEALLAACPSKTTPSSVARAPVASVARLVDVQDDMGRDPLFLAARSGRVEVVEALLRAKATVDVRDMNHCTPMLVATALNKVGVVKALLQGGASPNLKDSKGSSALYLALTKRHGDVFEALIAGKASIDLGGEKGMTPLHIACRGDTPGAVETLLRAGALPGHCWNDLLQSPLLEACTAGNMDAVKQLLPRLSVRQINLRDRVHSTREGGNTALLAAIECGHKGVEIVEALLEAGADPSIRSVSTHMSPLDICVSRTATAANPTLGPRLVRALIAAGVNVNEVGPEGIAALHHACQQGACGEIVQALLDAGADACAPCAGINFLTPLQLAGRGGNRGALRVMIGLPEYGGVDTVGDAPSRATVLACAVHSGSTDGVRFLLEEGADMDLIPFKDDGITPLAESLIHCAINLGHGRIASLLLQARRFMEESERESSENEMNLCGGTVLAVV